jgi:hypothetical protein
MSRQVSRATKIGGKKLDYGLKIIAEGLGSAIGFADRGLRRYGMYRDQDGSGV